MSPFHALLLSPSLSPAAAEPTPEIPPGQTFDVIISSTSDKDDVSLAQLIKGMCEISRARFCAPESGHMSQLVNTF